MKRKIRVKTSYFIKRKEENQKWKCRTSSTRKKLKTQVAQIIRKKNTLQRQKISTKTRRFQLQKRSNNKETKRPQKSAQY
jgi:hypothetical protein